jgi:hypothetical protein
MKIKTVLVAGLAGGIGYMLGTRGGQDRYEQIKAQADRLAHSPQVQETVTNLAEGVKKNAGKLPDPVADVVTKVADTVSSSTDAQPGSGVGAGLGTADLGDSEVGSPDVGTIDLGTTDVGSDLGTDLGETDTEPRRAE